MAHVVALSLRMAWRASPRGFLAAAALQLVGALSTTALIIVGKLTIDAIVAVPGGDARPALIQALVLLAVVTALGSSASTLQRQQQRLLGEEVGVAAWQRILDVTGRVELETFESPRFYDHLRRVEDNALSQPIVVTSALFGLLGGMVSVVGLLSVLLAIEPLIVPVLLLAGVPSLVLSRRSSRAEFAFITRATPIFRQRHYLRVVLTGRDEAKEVRAFGAERALRHRHDDRSDELLGQLRTNVRVRQAYALAGVATTALALMIALGLLVWFLVLGRITLADAGAAVLAIRLLSTSLDQLFQSVGGLFESGVFLDDLESFLTLASSTSARRSAGSPRLLREDVEVDGVSYKYPGSPDPVLHDVSVRVRRGEVIAIVGENGSGKTTLAKLMAGLYPPSGGTIRWDGVDTADVDPAELRRGVAVIFQDFVRYQLTALENIGLGDPDHVHDEDAARAAAKQARAAEFLEGLPHGYATVLSKEYEEGTDLSLGQWQRVALARALRRDAPLVILDEPSAALDPRAEQALFSDIRSTLHGRSAVLISHRFSTVRSADRIYVMRDGTVAESGSHEELMERDGLYAELFTLQAAGYVS